jgi:hypothetical protein
MKMPAEQTHMKKYNELLDLMKTTSTNFSDPEFEDLVQTYFKQIESIKKHIAASERETIYKAFVEWAATQHRLVYDLAFPKKEVLFAPSFDLEHKQKLSNVALSTYHTRSTITGRLNGIARANKKRKLTEEVNESAKRAKLMLQVDASRTTDICVGDKVFTIASDLLICILSFLKPRFKNSLKDPLTVPICENVMNIRLVNTMFCFAYQKTPGLWKMPKKLCLSPLGLQNYNTGCKVDSWSKRLFLYCLYNTEDKKQKDAMIKRMSTYKKLCKENENISSRDLTIFKRKMKMADSIRVPIPVELMNSECTLKIHPYTSQSLIDEWHALKEKGTSIFNLTRFKVYPNHTLKKILVYLDENYIPHFIESRMLTYEQYDVKQFLESLSTQIQTLKFSSHQDELFRSIDTATVFPNVYKLKSYSDLQRSDQLRRVFPSLSSKEYHLTEKGEKRLKQGPNAVFALWSRIPNNGIPKDVLFAENNKEQEEAYFKLMSKNFIFLSENQPGQLVVHRRGNEQTRKVRDYWYESLLRVSNNPKNEHRDLHVHKDKLKIMVRQKLLKVEKISIYET